MNLPLYWIDAFSDRVFAGNPAAVVPLDHWPDDKLLQEIARENGLSETAYFVRTGPGKARLRWFTPAVEVDLCGHATLAAAHVLFSELGETASTLEFATKSGVLTVRRKAPLIEMDFPARPAALAEPPAHLIEGLGRAPLATLRTERLWLCVYGTAEEVKALSPDHAVLSRVTPGRIIVTAPGADCDFVSRFFAPDAGIPEDPVTGSSHCTLVPYWAEKLGKNRLHARQVSARTGELWCEWLGNRVALSGRATLYLKGALSV